jgi:uncharacterized coiled-coil protein SlyX
MNILECRVAELEKRLRWHESILEALREQLTEYEQAGLAGRALRLYHTRVNSPLPNYGNSYSEDH